MCGIIGYVGSRASKDLLLQGLERLEYRGYDSAGIALLEDDGLDYVEFHLGSRGSRMRGQPNFRMVLIEHADHTFSTVASQQGLLSVVREHLDALHRPGERPLPVLPGSMATTA